MKNKIVMMIENHPPIIESDFINILLIPFMFIRKTISEFKCIKR